MIVPPGFDRQIQRFLLKDTVYRAPSGREIPIKVSRWRLLKWRVLALRERVGFWIAGYTPSDDDW